jgi:hypothetical protein
MDMDDYEDSDVDSIISESEYNGGYEEADPFLQHLMELRQQHAKKLSYLEQAYFSQSQQESGNDLVASGWFPSSTSIVNLTFCDSNSNRRILTIVTAEIELK